MSETGGGPHAAMAVVTLWVTADRTVGGRLWTVDDLASPDERVWVGHLDDLRMLLDDWFQHSARALRRGPSET